MQYYCIISLLITISTSLVHSDKINLDTLNNYSEFLNYGDKKLTKSKKNNLENAIFKSKLDTIGEIFKTNIDSLKVTSNLDVIFLIDASSSVGENNFKSELKFVKKLLSDVTVDYNHTRVAVVTFSSPNNVIIHIDEISQPSINNNKCLLLNKQLNNISYSGGETYTLGAFQLAKDIFQNSRNYSKKLLFLITDGFSNGGDPIPLANELKEQQIVIFTIGIQNGNYKELYEVSSQPGEFYSYLLDSFEEFEGLARRALHVDFKIGDYIPLGFNQPCDNLCKEGDCCDKNAMCSCGTTSGHYSCICEPGYYGSGLKNSCYPCIPGTYSDGPNLCLPCPDIHHTTTPPAFNIQNCTCKLGYQATKNNQCKILKCPKILIPSHGYLIKKKECGNVLNSACGIRCEVGYTLVGRSIRLCQANGTWSGAEPSCEVRTCTQIPTPKFGLMKCYQIDLDVTYENETNLPVDTVCEFHCSKGRTLIGSTQRTCLPLARWDGLRTSCKQIKCNRLPLIKYGTFEPKSCTVGKQDYGTNCTIVCQEGFKVNGSETVECNGDHGSWSRKFDNSVCIDVIAPNLTCPENITKESLPGKKFGYSSWTLPVVTDNTNLQIIVWMQPVIKDVSTFKFEIGTTPVTYFAQDIFQNQAECTFYIKIEDKEVPTIENCINPPPFLTTEKFGTNVTWDEPNIYDNSQNVFINKSHDFGFFKLGTTTVTYIAQDNSKNKNVCKLNITVEEAHCEVLPDPIYGHTDCNSDQNSIECVITCQEGYAIPLLQPQIDNSSSTTTNFLCNHSEAIWNNPEGLLTPECSVTKIPKEIQQEGEIILETSKEDPCSDNQTISELTNDIENSLQICTENCTINTQTDCEQEKYEEETNKIRRKRDFEVVPHRNKSKKNRKKLNVKFQIRGQYINETGGGKNNSDLRALQTKYGVNMTVVYHKPKFLCPIGFIPRKNRCVQCPKGTFHNVTRNRCQSCAFGFYNDKLGMAECVSCPLHFSTRKMHAKKHSDCKEQCSPGTYARRKILKHSKHNQNQPIERATLKPFCRSCDIGFYQPLYGQLQCFPCPKGFTTTGFGSISLQQCILTSLQLCAINRNICNNGTCIRNNDYQYSCKCFPNYIGSNCEKKITHCDSNPCLNGGGCQQDESGYSCTCPKGFKGKQCEQSDDTCGLPCINNGTCAQTSENETFCLCPSGFGGDFCETRIRYCNIDLCENNAICLESRNSFKCLCSPGYIGRRCNILPCDYQPCSGNYVCINTMEVNSTRNSFQCVCPDGYTGPKCTEKIDFCSSNPCENNGICSSNAQNYTCKCTALYFGPQCQNKRNTKYILHFPKYDTNDYLKLEGFQKNLTEITACLWMQTLDSFNYGNLLSYATSKFDNAFTLTDYTGLVLYINNQYAVTDILLNNGYWHHICVSWSNSQGNYRIVVDGKLVKNESGFATNSIIEGFGNMVIGQEQDVLGGRFSQSESFTGKMAYIDVWSKILTEDEILKHFNDCAEDFFGDLYAWPQMSDFIQGNIEILNSTFCGGCSQPRPVYHGLIRIEDNLAYYSCYDGYELSNFEYANGRRCSKASKWEGLYEPYCKKIYCGYPGYVRNGYIIGNKYFFQDQISYECYKGYNLTGNRTIFCKSNGKWSPEKPKCLGAQCPAFKQPENSNITIISDLSYEEKENISYSFDIATQIEINCTKNATLIGENLLTCTENGTWDFEPPTCELPKPPKPKLECSIDLLPKPPINGYLDVDSLNNAGNGTTNFVAFKCRPGYKLKGDNVSTCIIDGYWTVPNISCESAHCRRPPQPRNMVFKYDVMDNKIYEFGDMVQYECIEGYRIFGSNVIRCLPNGKWTRMIGRCNRKSCPDPDVTDDTTIIGNSYLYKDQITIQCPNNKEYVWTCNKFGIWDGDKDDTC